VFKNPEIGQTRLILIDAWQKHLQMHGDAPPRLPSEQTQLGDSRDMVRRKDTCYRNRVGHLWGLVEWMAYTCRRWGVSRVLIENAASGITAAQELQRLYGKEDWIVTLVKPKGDKVSRALAVQPLLAKQLVYAPAKDYADTLITQCSLFPHGRHDDLVDSTTQMLWWLRETSVLRLDEEVKADAVERVTYRHGSRRRPLYPC